MDGASSSARPEGGGPTAGYDDRQWKSACEDELPCGAGSRESERPLIRVSGRIDVQCFSFCQNGKELLAQLRPIFVDQGDVDARRLSQPDLLVEYESEDREKRDRNDERQQQFNFSVPHSQESDANHRPDHSRSSRPVRCMKTECSEGALISMSLTCLPDSWIRAISFGKSSAMSATSATSSRSPSFGNH